jgi:hypothetical protein
MSRKRTMNTHLTLPARVVAKRLVKPSAPASRDGAAAHQGPSKPEAGLRHFVREFGPGVLVSLASVALALFLSRLAPFERIGAAVSD